MKLKIGLVLGFVSTLLFGFFAPGKVSASTNLSGYVKDQAGSPASGVTVLVYSPDLATATTDESGYYSLSVATPGSYIVKFNGHNYVSRLSDIPETFSISVIDYNLSTDASLNVTIPAKSVMIHVQNQQNIPVAGVTLTTNTSANGDLDIGGVGAFGGSDYPSTGITTDSVGNATMWLFPNDAAPYDITAVPLAGSMYKALTITNITVSGSEDITLTLPVTGSTTPASAIAFSPGQDSQGFYSNPTTINLYAVASSGSSIANTFYTIDGNSTQMYQGPFTVSGSGNHTVDYWSVDNTGISELTNSKYFVIFADRPPAINTISGSTINEGDPYLADVYFNDPDSDSWTGTINYGDGSPVKNLTLLTANFNLSHIYKDNGVYTVTVSVTDNQGLTGTGTAAVTVNNLPPNVGTIGLNISGPVAVNTQVNANAPFTDPGVLDTHTAVWNWGDGTSSNGTVAETNGSGLATGTHTYATSGVYTLSLTVADKDGGVGVSQYQNVVVDAAPSINSIPNSVINEGDAYSLNSSFSDTDSTSWNGSVNYGDGSGVNSLPLSGSNFTLSHVYKDNGTYTVTVSVTDNQGLTGTGTAVITVNNVSPVVGVIGVNISGPVAINTQVNASASFTDPGVLDTHTATFNWGDGVTTGATVSGTNTLGTVSGSHNFLLPGVYSILLTVKDKDGGIGTSQYQYAVIYDPNAGFVVGAGLIKSPKGAETSLPSATGTALFGIDAKYYPGKNFPSGITLYAFGDGKLIFASTSYSWLIVNGNTAFLSGTGSVNGKGSYSFIMSAVDGSPDTLRIKISDSSNNVVYDNQMGADNMAVPAESISGGQIKIH